MQSQKEIEQLFHLFLADQCTEKELGLLAAYFNASENEFLLKSLIKKELEAFENIQPVQKDISQSFLNSVFQQIKKRIHHPGDNDKTKY